MYDSVVRSESQHGTIHMDRTSEGVTHDTAFVNLIFEATVLVSELAFLECMYTHLLGTIFKLHVP